MSDVDRNRRFLRKPIQAEFSVRDAGDESAAHGELHFDAVDISEGGAFLASELLLERGELLDIIFHLPDPDSGIERVFRVRARVAWANNKADRGDAGMGLEFLDLSEEERETIAAYVREH